MTDKNITSAYEVDKIDREMLQFITEFPDVSIEQIAKHVEISNSEVKHRTERPIFIRYLSQINESVEDIMERAQRAAAKKLMALTKSGNERIALDASRLILMPILSKNQIGNKKLAEVIHRSYIGEQGQLIQDIIEIEAENSKPKKVGQTKKVESTETIENNSEKQTELDVNDLF